MIRISSTPTCPKCRIELEHVVTFGGPEDSVTVGSQLRNTDSVTVGSQLRNTARGEYVTRSHWAPYQVAVFSATGKLLALRGRLGEGPGDYHGVEFIEVGRGDTLHVFDVNLRRQTLLAPGSWTVARTAPTPVFALLGTHILGRNPYVLFPDGRYVVNAERGDSALHLVGVEGDLVRSFGVGYGEEDLPPPPSRRHLSVLAPFETPELRRVDVIHRQLAAAGEGRIWAAYVGRYEIELWDTAGHRLRRLAREADWFKPWRGDEVAAKRRRHILRERERRGPDSPPPPYPPTFSALEQDDRGRIWTVISVEPWPAKTGAPREEDERHAIIEVLDPRVGRLLTSIRVPHMVENIVAPGLVAVRETRPSDGVHTVKVFRLVLLEG